MTAHQRATGASITPAPAGPQKAITGKHDALTKEDIFLERRISLKPFLAIQHHQQAMAVPSTAAGSHAHQPRNLEQSTSKIPTIHPAVRKMSQKPSNSIRVIG
jgi:hypothetical protein